jgi:hypothetical protein
LLKVPILRRENTEHNNILNENGSPWGLPIPNRNHARLGAIGPNDRHYPRHLTDARQDGSPSERTAFMMTMEINAAGSVAAARHPIL